MTARGFKPKTQLTPEEKITCAYMHICRGVDQHILADIYHVNHGRVNYAIMDVRKAVGLPTPIKEDDDENSLLPLMSTLPSASADG